MNIRNIKRVVVCTAIICLAGIAVGCGDKESDVQTTESRVMDGDVSSPDDFSQIGLYIDINRNDSAVTDVKYRISGDIAIVSFRYNGVKVELRGSCKYKEYELAGIKDNSNGNMIVTDIQGCNATFYTLDPGRAGFWSDGQINYSLFIYVTATDDVMKNIVSDVVFENRYEQRADVKDQRVSESKAFAEKIIKVFNDRDMDSMVDMMDFPQELGGGQSVANKSELLALDKDELFTDILMKALNDKSVVDNMRMSEDGSEYIIGTNYKNVHFKLSGNGTFVITKINN